MIIGFLSNKLTLRGTEIALFDYAYFNETLLNNNSIIITRPYDKVKHERDTSEEAYFKFSKRFKVEFYHQQNDIDDIVSKHNINILYIIKNGMYNDNVYTTRCRNAIHCVFGTYFPVPPPLLNSSKIAVISNPVNERCNSNFPIVPHMINIPISNINLKTELNIPSNSLVFGTYSGSDANVPYILEVVKRIVNEDKNIYFIFMNIEPFIDHPKVIFIRGTANMEVKSRFINTCDGMLYSRQLGETFGIAIGEFSMHNKPIICCREAEDKFHLQTLGSNCLLHSNAEQLYEILTHWNIYKKNINVNDNKYKIYTPEYVMNIFKKTFID